jgi:hypothetical protein
MEKIDLGCWSRHAFGTKCKTDTISNIVESFNSWIKKARDKPLTNRRCSKTSNLLETHTKSVLSEVSFHILLTSSTQIVWEIGLGKILAN